MGVNPSIRRSKATGWLTVAIVTWGLGLAAITSAVVHQQSTTEPIGEGELFLDDTTVAADYISDASDPDMGVRQARNSLEVEAVSLIDSEGMITASTSDSLVGRPVTNPLLGYGIGSRRFTALASEIGTTIELDGVETWPAGTVLYEALLPLEDGTSVMIHYDIAELLGRRAQPGDIQALTIQLVVLGVIFAVLGTAMFVGHNRAVARQRQLTRESELLREHATALEDANEQLVVARTRAEAALALAEEKMRIRSEFVLMINHELRTPLTAMVTGAHVIRDAKLDDAERDAMIEELVEQGDRLSEIIDQILAVARIENRGLAYELTPTPLTAAAEGVGAEVRTDADVSRIEVRTDTGALGLVVNTLSGNARTHGASTVQVTFSDSPIVDPLVQHGPMPERAVYLAVSDDGPGIDPGFLPRAFEKFEKDSFSSGTGLGLYMVRLMVEALGGSVGVATSPSGTTFEIALPATIKEREMEHV